MLSGVDPSGPPNGLTAEGVTVDFEGLRALDEVEIMVSPDDVLGLIGPNGAGKTTLVNVLTGFQAPSAGAVRLGDKDITRWAPARVARAGVVRTFQGSRCFGDLTVYENVEVGAVGAGASPRQASALSWELLERTHLAERAGQLARELPHGEERRLGVARAVATRSTFLLLDEPGSGLNEKETDDLVEILEELRRDFGIGLLVIEHDMRLVMAICHRIQVLDHGKTIAIGNWDHIRNHPDVLEAYLGREYE